MPTEDHILNLIRQYVDGELPDAESETFERRLEEDSDLRTRVQCEREFAARIGKVLKASDYEYNRAAPAELRSQIAARLAQDPPAVAGTIGKKPGAGMNAFAVAASLLLVAGAVLWGMFGKKLDDVGGGIGQRSLVGDAALYVSEEHLRCANDPRTRESKLVFRTQAELRQELTRYLGAKLSIVDLGHLGYEFAGGGFCMVPGDPRSGHMIYIRRPQGNRGGAMISIFVVPDTGQFPPDSQPGAPPGMEPGNWYAADGGPRCQHQVFRSSDGALVYFVVCCDEDDLAGVKNAIVRSID